MKRVVWRVLATLVCLLVAFGAITWSALEWSGVAILRTERPDGSARTTHVWYAKDGGSLWLEAATRERDFLSDMQRHPDVNLSIDDRVASYRTEILLEPSAHEHIRELLRGKYGWRDWWVGLLQDTSGSIAVRLNPSGVESG